MLKVAGRMIASSTVNGGPSFPHLSPAVNRYLTSLSIENTLADITRSDVVDYNVLEAIDKVYEIRASKPLHWPSLKKETKIHFLRIISVLPLTNFNE